MEEEIVYAKLGKGDETELADKCTFLIIHWTIGNMVNVLLQAYN
jgi:hypothetical protein